MNWKNNYGFHISIFAKNKEILYKEISPELIKAQRSVEVNISYFLTTDDEPYCYIDQFRYNGIDGIKKGLGDLVNRYG